MKYLGPHTDTAPLDVTLVLRRRQGGVPRSPALAAARRARARADFGQHCGADPADLERLRAFARTHGLDRDRRRRAAARAAPVGRRRRRSARLRRHARAAMSSATAAVRSSAADTRRRCRRRRLAVLGLDRRPVARAHFRRPRATPSATYTPPQLGALYAVSGRHGRQRRRRVAHHRARRRLQRERPGAVLQGPGHQKAPTVTAVGVAGGTNTPGGDADGEVMLDIEVIGALAPGAGIVVYFAPNTDQGFYEAISQAAHDTVSKPSRDVDQLGRSGGQLDRVRRAMPCRRALEDAAALGGHGDGGGGRQRSADGESDGQPHVDFPGLESVRARLRRHQAHRPRQRDQSEVVWNETSSGEGATGGGVSVEFALPAWQRAARVPKAPNGSAGRGVPDVAGNADPHDRLPGAGGRAGAGDRRHERGGAAVGGADRTLQPETRRAARRCARSALPDRRGRLPRHHAAATTAPTRQAPAGMRAPVWAHPDGEALLQRTGGAEELTGGAPHQPAGAG